MPLPRILTLISLTSLSGLAQDALVRVLDALALVGFRSAQLADVSGDLANDLLVGALDDHFVSVRQFESDAFRRVDGDRVSIRWNVNTL